MHLRHKASITWGRYPLGRLRKVINQSWDLQDECTWAYKCVSLQSRATNKSRQVPKSAPTQGRQLCHGFVSAGDALGRARPATPM